MFPITPDDRTSEGGGYGPEPPVPSRPANSPPADDAPPTVPPGHSFEPAGLAIRRGMILLGILLGGSRLLAGIGEGQAMAAAFARSTLDAAAIAVGFGLAGYLLQRAAQMVAFTLAARANRDARWGASLLDRADRAIDAIERVSGAIERRGPAGAPAAAPGDRERTRLIGEIGKALREARLDEAEALLQRLDDESPGEPAAADLREQVDAARRHQAEERVAQIDAARRVNDADRVLELYAAVGPSLEFDRRGELERDLARWFLDLIHRRLRVGRIQPEVVALAGRAAETFGATVEGASLRASLPVLRRSVGLCPRCARPYVGADAACPRCQAGVPPDAVLPTMPDPPPGPAPAG